jgi:FkbM family methyltransferase
MSIKETLFKQIWSLIPLRQRAWIHQSDLDILKLDYPGKDLYLHMNSLIDVRRAQSCAKEPGTVEWLEKDVEDGSVFFDIGANIGAYSLIAWGKSGGKTKVYAFEPGLTTYPQLCRNILLNRAHEGIQALNVALSNQTSLQHFKYNNLLPGAAEHLGLSDSTSASAQHTQKVVFSQPVLTHSLDEAMPLFGLPQPNHIKIDVDGHELEILQGAAKALQNAAMRTVQIEIGEKDPASPKIKALLESLGYKVKRVSPHGDGAIADYVFAK